LRKNWIFWKKNWNFFNLNFWINFAELYLKKNFFRQFSSIFYLIHIQNLQISSPQFKKNIFKIKLYAILILLSQEYPQKTGVCRPQTDFTVQFKKLNISCAVLFLWFTQSTWLCKRKISLKLELPIYIHEGKMN